MTDFLTACMCIASAELLIKVRKIKSEFDQEQAKVENEIVVEFDGKLKLWELYTLPEVICIESQRFSKLPDKCPNEMKKEILEALNLTRNSFPMMLSQPGAVLTSKICFPEVVDETHKHIDAMQEE